MPDHTSLLVKRRQTCRSQTAEELDRTASVCRLPTAICRLPNTNDSLSLRELEPGAGPALTVLLALLHPGVARQEAFLLELLAQLLVVLGERPRNAVADRTGLARGSAAGDR